MSRIDHVIVLMLENRSFDNVLGYLDHPDPAFDGVRGKDLDNPTCDGTTTIPVTGCGTPCGIDPGHGHVEVLRQIGGAAAPDMRGFVCSHERVLAAHGRDPSAAGAVMRCLDPMRWNPALATLATEFAVCQRWFSSVPGETWPNRSFAHAGTSDGTVDIEFGFYWDRTIFETLEDAGKSWRVYYDGPPHLWCYRRLWGPRTIWDVALRRPMRTGRWFRADRLVGHIETGTLPTYAFVEPAHNTLGNPRRRTNSQHPGSNTTSPDDFIAGDELVSDIYQALRATPELFARTLFVITYDEHGGLYDHVAPPVVPAPGDPSDRRVSRWIGRFARRVADRVARRPQAPPFAFTRLGVRVPAVLVSPWIERHTLVDDPLEHASIPATLRALFADRHGPLTARDAAASTFHRVVLDSPRTSPRRASAAEPADGLPDLSAVPRLPWDPKTEPCMVTPSSTRSDLDVELDGLALRVDRVLSRRGPARRGGRAAGPAIAAAPNPVARAVARFDAAAEDARSHR